MTVNTQPNAGLPKVELHCHLDCCLSYHVVQQLDPSISYATYQESFIAPAKCTDLADYITRAVRGFELMQTPEQLRLVTLDLFDQLKEDGVIYAELRFAPLQHLAGGLTPAEVVQTVEAATREGMAATEVEASLILCTLRHYSAEQSLETIRLVEQFIGTSVVGFDIAADEAGYPIDSHIAAFEYARQKGIPCTAHAGEARGADSVWETLRHFHPARIGHGVRSWEDQELIQYIKDEDIHLELCITSNIQTNVYPDFADHTANQLYDAGVSVSINTDARTISDTSLTNEYNLLSREFGWKKAHFLRCNLEALRHSFIGGERKQALANRLVEAYRQT